MKYISVFFFMCVALQLLAQQLIENGSFEDGRCPVKHSVKPHDFVVNGWFTPDDSTPDYYHRCSQSEAGVPKSWSGNMLPKQGDGAVGIYLIRGRYQENLGTALTHTLLRDSVYLLEFSIANATNSDFLASEISITFSDVPLQMDHTEDYDLRQFTLPIPEPGEFDHFSWRSIRMKYKALGNESYFYLGPLRNPGAVGKKNQYRLDDEPMLDESVYVYLDAVSLTPLFKIPSEEPTFELSDKLDPIAVLFDFDSAIPKGTESLGLDTLQDFVHRNSLFLLVTGSTDSVGTSEYNLSLGKMRAEAIRDILAFSGIDTLRIEAVSRGEETPNYSNHSEEYRSLNRNVLIEFFRKTNQ